jgi:hypothetical protein
MQNPRVRENILYQEVDSEVVLFDKTRRKVYRLDRVSGLIFYFCDGDYAEQDILVELKQVFKDVDPATLAADLKNTLETFSKEKIIC